MKLWITAACLALAGCDSSGRGKPTIVDGVSVTINQPEVSVKNGRLFIGNTDHGAVQEGDKVVVGYCGVTVNGQPRIPPP